MSLQPESSHPAVEGVAGLHAALDQVSEANLWSLSTAELGRLVVASERAARRLAALQVKLTAQAETARVSEHEGATSLPAWLKAAADVPVATTRARLRLHDSLRSRRHAAGAFAAGEVSMEAAQAICTAMEQLPPEVPARLNERVERLLVEVASEEGTAAVVRRAAEIGHRFAPDALEQAEARQREQTRLRLVQRHDGTVALHGVLDKESGALAWAVLGPHAVPAPSSDGVPDTRDAETRYGEAFVQVLRLASAASPSVRGEPPHLHVTIGLDGLQGWLNAAPGRLENGVPLSAGAARRLACDAVVIPVVLGAASEPLDVGRATRLVPLPMRRALAVRDQGCAMPGCERPTSWCDAHHCRPWMEGGETALHNLVLLCERHHGVVHHDGWRVEIIEGRPWFTPPGWLDPHRNPRLHTRFKTRDFDP